METKEHEITEAQLLADIHNMLSDIHEAMFVDADEDGEDEDDAEGEDADDAEIENDEDEEDAA